MQSSESEVCKCFTFFKLRYQKLFQQFAACTKSKVIQSPPTISSPAQPARTQSCYWPVTDSVRQVAHPTAGTGNSGTCRMAGQGPPLFPRVTQTWADIRRKEKKRIQNNLAQGIYILASGARLAQHPSVKNLWGSAGPSSPFPCIFCLEKNILHSVTFSTIPLYF